MVRNTILLVCACAIPAMLKAQTTQPGAETGRPVVQLALLLDTSNSMDGLIDQAKSQLWKVVNEFITAKRNGQRPELQVALYEYGNTRLSKESGWIRQVLPLTTDLDKVSEELFALKTSGGEEYCGQVIQASVKNLKWSSRGDDLKVIFIAGNEPFTQGPVDFRGACKAAVGRGITINTIFCGPQQEGISTQWKEGAVVADGAFMSIDQNRAVVHVEAPQDKEIARLGAEINKTYVPYGKDGGRGMTNQFAQDSNALQVTGGAMLQRSLTKSSANYLNSSWDLVDAVKEGTVKLDGLKAEDLPEPMRRMDANGRKAWLDGKAKERASVQQQIAKLNTERTRYLAEQAKKPTTSPAADTLDTAMIRSVREQAGRKSIRFE